MPTSPTQACPECGATVPTSFGYVSWCHACGWNVAAAHELPAPRTRLDRLSAAVARRLGDRLVAELIGTGRLRPRLTPAKAVAYLIAAVVFGMTVLLLAGGALLAVLNFPSITAILLGAFLVGLGTLMRPRVGKAPKEDIVGRHEAPRLFELVDEISRTLGLRNVDVLVVNEDFNASWAVLGARRRRVLTLGLPLLAALAPQERVAVVAHELAHGQNGDARRGFFVGSAVNGLAELYGVLAPDDETHEGSGLEIVEHLAHFVQRVLSWPVLGLLVLQLHLLLRDSQRAEYLADALAAEVAGTSAVIAAHEQLLLESTVRAAVQHVARASDRADLFDEIALAVANVPERERERRRAAARLEGPRLDATHPPTARRLEVLEGRQMQAPAVILDASRSALIDEELARLRPELQRRLVEDYRDRLYYG